jgi:hypothetical protein
VPNSIFDPAVADLGFKKFFAVVATSATFTFIFIAYEIDATIPLADAFLRSFSGGPRPTRPEKSWHYLRALRFTLLPYSTEYSRSTIISSQNEETHNPNNLSSFAQVL